jgi:hypothetical protein
MKLIVLTRVIFISITRYILVRMSVNSRLINKYFYLFNINFFKFSLSFKYNLQSTKIILNLNNSFALINMFLIKVSIYNIKTKKSNLNIVKRKNKSDLISTVNSKSNLDDFLKRPLIIDKYEFREDFNYTTLNEIVNLQHIQYY